MKIERKDIDNLNIQLELVLEQADYKPVFDKKLKEYRGKAQMKGFRQGKTPMGLVKKMYGSGIFSEVINDELSTKLNNYLVEEKINYLGQPMSAEDQVLYEFDFNNMEDYTFTFDIGLKPDIKLKGYSKQTKYNDYQILVGEDLIEKELTHIKTSFGERGQVDTKVEDNDVVKFAAVEQDGKKDKEGGVTTEISSLVKNIPNEKLKKKILKLKKGDSIVFDVYELEQIKDEAYLKKFVLGIEEDVECGNMYNGEIIEVTRVEPAELNEETFKKYFGEESGIKTEEEAKTKIKENIQNYFKGSALSLSNREMLEKVLDKNEFALPEGILKRWLKSANEELTDEQLDGDMEGFLKDLRWRLIKNMIAADNKVEVTYDELRNMMYVRVESYFRNNHMFDVAQINKTVDQLMQDKEQIEQAQEEILSSKVFEIIREKVGLKAVDVTPEDMNKKIEKYNDK